jgi:hypothetical protein
MVLCGGELSRLWYRSGPDEWTMVDRVGVWVGHPGAIPKTIGTPT